MNKKQVKKLIAKAVAKAEKRVEYELELIGERQHAQKMSLLALEEQIKQPQQKEQPRVPLNPSDWYSPGGFSTASSGQRAPQYKHVRFLMVGKPSYSPFYLNETQYVQLIEMGVRMRANLSELHDKGTVWAVHPYSKTTQNVGDLTREVNAILAPDYRVYAEVRNID